MNTAAAAARHTLAHTGRSAALPLAALLGLSLMSTTRVFTVMASASAPPPITLYHNVNNVDGRAAYRADEGVVVYLGSFEDLAGCEAACLAFARGGERCNSFAWHGANMVDPDPRSYRTLCYGVTDASFRDAKETNVTSGVVCCVSVSLARRPACPRALPGPVRALPCAAPCRAPAVLPPRRPDAPAPRAPCPSRAGLRENGAVRLGALRPASGRAGTRSPLRLGLACLPRATTRRRGQR